MYDALTAARLPLQMHLIGIDIHAQLEESLADVLRKQADIERLNSTCDQLRAELKNATTTASKHETELVVAKTQFDKGISDARQTIHTMEMQAKEKEEHIGSLNEKHLTSREEGAALVSQINQAREELRVEWGAKVSSLSEALEQKQANMQTLRAEIGQLKSGKSMQKSELEKQKVDILALESQAAAAANEAYAGMQRKDVEILATTNGFSDQLQDVSKERAVAQAQAETARDARDSLEAALTLQREQNAVLTEQLESVKSELETQVCWVPRAQIVFARALSHLTLFGAGVHCD